MEIFNIVAGLASVTSLIITIYVSLKAKEIKEETAQIYADTLQIKNEISVNLQNTNNQTQTTTKSTGDISQSNSNGSNHVSVQ